MTILAVPSYLAHEGGTKFYEIVALSANGGKGPFVLVKRWGKMDARRAGGEIQIETATSHRELLGMLEKYRNAKQKRGYSVSTANWGLYGTDSSAVPEAAVKTLIMAHYGKNARAVLGALELYTGVRADTIVVDEMPEVAAAPVPEPDRGEGWGCW